MATVEITRRVSMRQDGMCLQELEYDGGVEEEEAGRLC